MQLRWNSIQRVWEELISNQTLGAVSRSKEFGFWGGKQQIPTVSIVPSFQHVMRIQETVSSTLILEQKVPSDVIP